MDFLFVSHFFTIIDSLKIRLPLYKVLLSFICSVILLHANAQQTTLKGKVRDKRTGEALIGAVVSVKGTGTGASTDFDGEFTLKVNQSPPFTIAVSMMGYERVDINVTSNNKPIDIRLIEKVAELQAVEIKDSRITQKQKQAPLTVETMDAVAIKETPAASFYEGLAHLKGVDLTSASIGFKIINTRGFNSTSPVRSLQLIDGVDNQSPGLNFSLGNFLGASELDIQKVDLVVGASSAYFGPNAFNGVINMQTKSPFLYPGLSMMAKTGERNLYEGGFRWAQVFKNKEGKERYAYKINMYWMQARDWEATNYDATEQSPVDERNPGGYDAVNRYGDEYSSNRFTQTGLQYIGHGFGLRRGYNEQDIVDYNTRNLKTNASVHYKNKKDVEYLIGSAFSYGTTVYQGDNRFSLKDIQFFQHKAEVRKENKFFVRAYMTHEDAGNSYDAYSTALILQQNAKNDANWAKLYSENWTKWIYNRMNAIRSREFPPLPVGQRPPGYNYEAEANKFFYENYYDSLVMWHRLVRDSTDFGTPSAVQGGLAHFLPGTARFDSAFRATTSLTNREGGSRFFDQSALYHLAGEYRFNIKQTEFITGGNFRLYAPYSRGTIFLDTGETRIYNREGGVYLGVEHKFFNNKLKVGVTNRVDKNENFDFLWSPAATAVYTHKEHVFRISVSSAVRNPTLTDQYINLNVGRATLLGNLNGFDSLVTVASIIESFNNNNDRSRLQYFNVAPVKPEEVKTIEFGYRTTILKKLFIDANYYRSWYNNFIGYIIGADLNWPASDPFVRGINIYRVAANAIGDVTTEGFTIGANYFWRKYLGFNANYSWNVLQKAEERDPLIPAFNTPENKYNLGISGRNIVSKIGSFIINDWGYSINYKWQEGFIFEGSPQFTGFVPAYDMLDAQVSKKVAKWNATFKLGASNVLDNRIFQVYGGPRIGRLIYFSILVEFDKPKQ
jgi:outer membrane receptor protein involved in Fe transport